jgi:hypothetical protein
VSTVDDDERLRGRYGRTFAPSGEGDAGAGLEVLGLPGTSGIFPPPGVKDAIVGEIRLMRDADDERRETYGRGDCLSTAGDVGWGDAGGGSCCDGASCGISIPNWSVNGRGGGRSTIASRSCP